MHSSGTVDDEFVTRSEETAIEDEEPGSQLKESGTVDDESRSRPEESGTVDKEYGSRLEDPGIVFDIGVENPTGVLKILARAHPLFHPELSNLLDTLGVHISNPLLLSESVLEIANYIADDFTNEEIAEEIWQIYINGSELPREHIFRD